MREKTLRLRSVHGTGAKDFCALLLLPSCVAGADVLASDGKELLRDVLLLGTGLKSVQVFGRAFVGRSCCCAVALPGWTTASAGALA